MQDAKEPLLPHPLHILGGVGAFLAGVGVAKVVGGVDVLPIDLFEHYGPTFIAAGVVLVLPVLIHVIRKSTERRDDEKGP